ncbi:MAG: type III toxin-antitoxin system ToxN/AbiQ family toxin [Lachnospiraceae bacterium]|nr:type III toxin-antitoxin system ToxN/AbiQ family toxin [Lachnospiraceae bacterium]
MYWIDIDDKYLDFLREFEERIPYSDYGTDKMKPFFGVLFDTEEFSYVTQVSHPQIRHEKMKQARDFYKLYDNDSNRLIGVVNLNYMFPVLKDKIVKLEMSNIDKIRTFKNETQKSKYIDLLNRELKEINKLPIEKNAFKLYKDKYTYPESFISKRCLDYKALENRARDWENNRNK